MRGRDWLGIAVATGLMTAALVVPTAVGASANPAMPMVADTTPPPSSPGSSPVPTGQPFPCNSGPVIQTPPPSPPTAPGQPVVDRVLLNRVEMHWGASTDEDGVICYTVFEQLPAGGSRLVTTFQTNTPPATTSGSFTLPFPPSGTPSEDHVLVVQATDRRGAVSPNSPPVTVRIFQDVISSPSPSSSIALPCRTAPVPPSAPPNLAPFAPGRPQVVSVLLNQVRLSWVAATDPDGSIACYSVFEDLGNGTSRRLATLQPAATEVTLFLPFPPSGVVSQDHILYVTAIDNQGATSPPSQSVTVRILNDQLPGSPSSSPANCDVEYTSTAWNNGMSTSITVKNIGVSTIANWRLTFTFPNSGQRVVSGWGGTWTQSGADVTAVGMSWNRDIAPGQTYYIGFTGSHTGANPAPPVFRINGVTCV